MLNYPFWKIEIDGDTYQIEAAVIQYFSIQASIENLYYTGSLVLMDNEGLFVGQLKGRIGAKIRVTLSDDDNNVSTYNFRISKINVPPKSNDDVSRFDSLGGDVYIDLIASWVWEMTYINQGYRGSVSDIVADVTQNFGRFSSTNIVRTDDEPRLRFRVAESEMKFIGEKLKPYANILNKPTYFFTDEKNCFNLTSFNDMYLIDSGYVIVPPVETLQSADNAVNLKLPEFPTKDVLALISTNVLLGGSDEAFFNLKQKLQLFSPEDQRSSLVDSFFVKDTGNIPFDKALYDSVSKTSLTSYSDARSLADQKAAQNNNGRYIEDFIEVTVICGLAIDKAYVGQTVELLFYKPGDMSKLHWVSGKFVIKAAEHGCERGVNFSRLICIAYAKNVDIGLDPSQLI